MANILIIDDDPVYADMAKQRLERAGHTVTLHLGPFGATVAAASDGLDLLILDVFMPALSGPDLLTIIRKNAKRGKRCRVLFCSSMDPFPLSLLATEHGADHIAKSADRAQFLAAVEHALGR